ncbi:inositol monophosphatase family protein [Glutamicibacter protophormiae]|uniref:inositol monophosphatase family protein n=1 Tax=Glutamicibacter protophormiae TaxID=37930 RepID=UPI002A7EA75F|nr:inositol monophosphatase family protein [Glutamicibacter protophormiae]WPR65342.1 inositol monophosphatase family protein [Glutamicibacter protophormiae]WPR68839.1 inositol monophosphatase family protein [Glutamicibacter protophormiae]
MIDLSEAHLESTAATLRSAALSAGRQAADLLRGAFRGGVRAEEKTNTHDLVTTIDRQSQELITRSLRAAVAGSWVLGEEQVDAEAGSAAPGTVQWIVDPIDGTSNFVHGIAFFCVSIAAAIDDRLVAAAVIDPVSGDEFSADLAHAYLNGHILSPAARPEQARANLMTDYPGAESLVADGPLALELLGGWIHDFATVRRKVSAALALAHVAAGWCDATIGFDTKVWDVAAGAHLVRMAGGSYTGLGYGTQFAADHLCPGFIAQGPGADYPSLSLAAQRMHARRSARSAI